MPKFMVHGLQLTAVMGEVDAEDEAEAIDKAWRGEWEDGCRWPDTEPKGNTRKRSWTAEPTEGGASDAE